MVDPTPKVQTWTHMQKRLGVLHGKTHALLHPQMRAYRHWVYDVQGDGSCFWQAVIHQVPPDHVIWSEGWDGKRVNSLKRVVHRLLTGHIQNHASRYEQYQPQDGVTDDELKAFYGFNDQDPQFGAKLKAANMIGVRDTYIGASGFKEVAWTLAYVLQQSITIATVSSDFTHDGGGHSDSWWCHAPRDYDPDFRAHNPDKENRLMRQYQALVDIFPFSPHFRYQGHWVPNEYQRFMDTEAFAARARSGLYPQELGATMLLVMTVPFEGQEGQSGHYMTACSLDFPSLFKRRRKII